MNEPESSPGGAPVRSSASYTACTVASPAFLPHAKVMSDSVLAHDPSAAVCILVLADDPQPPVAFDPRVEVLALSDVLDPDEAARLGLMYSTQGLAGALKPRLLRHILERDGGVAILIDADICLFGSLADTAQLAATGGPLLTTHSITPRPESDLPMLKAGVFNSGFMACGESAIGLLDWWCEWTRRDCIYQPWDGMLWEQAWLGLAPAFFEVQVPRDQGVNVLGVELLEADVEWAGDQPRLAGSPLRCFHFSGPYDPHRPSSIVCAGPTDHPEIRIESVSGLDVTWLSLDNKPGTLKISEIYAERLIEAGFDERDDDPIYSRIEGRPIHRGVRRAYRTGVLAAEGGDAEAPPNPFASATPQELYDWLSAAPDELAEEQGLTRFALGVWSSFYGATSIFPQVPGEDGPAFLEWFEERIGRERVFVPPALLPAGSNQPSGSTEQKGWPGRTMTSLRAARSFARQGRDQERQSRRPVRPARSRRHSE